MKDEIIAAIAAYLDTKKVRSWRVNSVEEYLPQWPLEKATIAKEIAAAIEPLVQSQLAKNEKYLEEINTLMWQTCGIKNAPFGREEGEKIMKILNEWAK